MANRNKNAMRGKFRNNKSRGRDLNKEEEQNCSSSDYSKGFGAAPNDLSWYVVDDQILNDAARVPYSLPVGMPFTREGKVTPMSGTIFASYHDAVPGMMVSWIVPLLGNAKDPSDAVNVAANSVYQFVRSRISGSRNYDAVDMMIYLGAMDSLFCYVTWLTRLYSTVFTYHQANRYMSRALVEAQGVDYDDLVSNLSSFRMRVNAEVAKIRALYLPAILPIFRRHSWLFSHYYIEGESEKDQIYFHVPAAVHRFKYDSDGAGMLECLALRNQGPLTTTNLLNVLSNMINPIYHDEDFNRIAGDFMKAYEGNVFVVETIPDIVTTNLIYNEEVLLQFKNAKYKTVGMYNDKIPFFDYTQDSTKLYLQMNGSKSYLMQYIQVTSSTNRYIKVDAAAASNYKHDMSVIQYDWSKDTMLTSPHRDVVPGETMINTRLTLAFEMKNDAASPTGITFNEMYFGSEWPMEYDIYCYHRDKSTNITSLFHRMYDTHLMTYTRYDDVSSIESWVLSQDPIRSAFKYLPELMLVYVSEDNNHLNNPQFYEPGRTIFEVDNYALVNQSVIGGLHNAAILGEYNIPKLAISR